MNQGRYRVIFNKATGVFAAVSELAKRHAKSTTSGEHVADVSAISGFFARFSKIAVCIALFCNGINIVSAQIVADPNASQQPNVTTAPNNVPNVQIVAPNAAGVSHNQYNKFNVDQQGAILSNNPHAANTQLGGWVAPNPNLQQSGSAKVIINEVTSTSKTVLKGFLEVAGQKADVVVSNPNGISVGNFGFINAQRGVLTTGAPVFGGTGSLEAFRVEQGKITVVQGKKLDDRITEQTDLIARSVQINGEIWANQLNIVAGSNKVNYADLGVTVIKGKGSKPQVAIDVAVLGGLYANKINLVGTEAGVGVTSYGAMAADVSNVKITSAGHVNVGGKTVAAQDIIIKSEGKIINQFGGVLHAKGDVTLTSKTDIRNTGLIVSDQETSVAASNIHNDGRIYGDTITLSASGQIDNGRDKASDHAAGAVAAHDALTLAANYVNNNNGALLLTESGMLKIHGAGGEKTRANTVTNASSKIDAGSDLVINTKVLNNTNTHYKTGEKVERQHMVTLHEGRGADGDKHFSPGQADIVSGRDYDRLVYTDENGRQVRRDQFTVDDFTRTTTETILEKSTPGELIARGDMTLSGKVTNDKSIIAASGDIKGDIESLDNIDGKGEKIVHDAGHRKYHTIEDAGWHTKSKNKYIFAGKIDQVKERLTTDLVLAKKTAHDGTLHPATSHADKEAASLLSQIDSQLYRKAAPGQNYLIETDPAFTNYATFISSDYLLKAIGVTGKQHLGDGYYEQKMVMEQIIRLIGHRDIAQGLSTEEQYKVLMDAALSVQDKLALKAGAALTPAQQQALTRDIVWMVSQTIKLPNGQETDVLSPVVYLAHSKADATPVTTAMMTANNIAITAKNKISNSGLIAADNNVSLSSGQDIANVYGGIHSHGEAARVHLDAKGNINNTSASISGADVSLHAGKSVSIGTNTKGNSGVNGTNSNLDRMSEVAGNTLAIHASQDIHINAAEILAEKDMSLNAQGHITLDAVTTQNENNFKAKDSHSNSLKTTVNGATVRSNGDVTLHAGKGVSTQAAVIAGEGKVDVQAQGNVVIGDATARYRYDAAFTETTKHWFMNRKTTEASRTSEVIEQSVGSHVVGKDINIQSGKQLRITGSSVAATNDIALTANKGVVIEAGKNHTEKHTATQKTSSWSFLPDGTALPEHTLLGQGLRSMYGLNFLRSETDASTQSDMQADTNTKSQIVSRQGDIRISSKENVVVKGADIEAGHDTSIDGTSVSFEAVKDTYQQSGRARESKSGLSFSADGLIKDLYDTAVKINEANRDYQDSDSALDKKRRNTQIGRLISQSAGAAWGYLKDLNKAQEATKAATGAAGVAEGESKGDASSVKLLGIHVSTGKTVNKQTYSSSSTNQIGDVVKAANNVRINAHGDPVKKQGDLHAVGTQITGKNIDLKTTGNIHVESAKNEHDSSQDNTSSGYRVGLGFNFGGPQNGLTGEVGANQGAGEVNERSLQHNNAHINAANTLTVTSGQDVKLKGAQLHGEKVDMQVAGNLNIASQQDTRHYFSEQTDNSLNASICAFYCTGTPVVGSVGPVGTTIEGDYAAVQEQSGIYAGHQGFDIRVAGNTDLTGSVIASTASREQNKLTTGTLTTSEIVNESEYRVKQSNQTISYNGDLFSSAIQNAATWLLGNSDTQPQKVISLTRSAIADGNITIEDNQEQIRKTGKTGTETLAAIDHDTAAAHQQLAPNFDIEKIKKEIEIKETMTQIVRDLAPIIESKVGDVLSHDMLNNKSTKVAVHAAIDGALARIMGGDWKSGMAAGAASTLALELFAKDLGKIPGLKGDANKSKRESLTQLVSMVVAKSTAQLAGGSVDAGNAAAVIAQQAAEFNYLKHAEVDMVEKEYNACGKDEACKTQVVKKAEEISDKNNADLIESCKSSDSQACISHLKEALDYAAEHNDSEELAFLKGDIRGSRKVYLDQVFKGDDGYQYYSDIYDRKKFFAATDAALKDKGHDVVWFKAAESVSKKLSWVTWVLSDSSDEVRWMDKVGNYVVKSGWGEFKDIYRMDSALKGIYAQKWDSKRLSNEQNRVQFLYEGGVPFAFELGAKSQQVPDITNPNHRIKAGEKMMQELRGKSSINYEGKNK